VSDEQFLTSPFLPRFHLFSHKLKLKSVKKLHLEIRGSSEPPRPPHSYGPDLCGPLGPFGALLPGLPLISYATEQ